MITVESIVDDILAEGKKYIDNKVGRYHDWADTPTHKSFMVEYAFPKDVAPFYCNDKPLPNIDVVKKEGIVCWGLTNLMLRGAGVPLPSVKKCKSYKDSKGPCMGDTGDIGFGVGGSDEWLYLFADKVELWKKYLDDPELTLPKGTLLLRNFDDLTGGHTAILAEDSKPNQLMEARVIHSAGEGLSDNQNVNEEPIGNQEKMFKVKYRKWDTGRNYPNLLCESPYYHAVLRPEHYIDVEEVKKERERQAELEDKEAKREGTIANLLSLMGGNEKDNNINIRF